MKLAYAHALFNLYTRIQNYEVPDDMSTDLEKNITEEIVMTSVHLGSRPFVPSIQINDMNIDAVSTDLLDYGSRNIQKSDAPILQKATTTVIETAKDEFLQKIENDIGSFLNL
ncbi:MAG: hypothetical protein ABIO02_02900 [Patescibacteria group bacterium]